LEGCSSLDSALSLQSEYNMSQIPSRVTSRHN